VTISRQGCTENLMSRSRCFRPLEGSAWVCDTTQHLVNMLLFRHLRQSIVESVYVLLSSRSFARSFVRLAVNPLRANKSTSTGRFFVKFYYGNFYFLLSTLKRWLKIF